MKFESRYTEVSVELTPSQVTDPQPESAFLFIIRVGVLSCL